MEDQAAHQRLAKVHPAWALETQQVTQSVSSRLRHHLAFSRWWLIQDCDLGSSKPSLLLFVVPCPVLVLGSSCRAVTARINNCKALRKAVGTWEVVDKVSIAAIIITNMTHLYFLPGTWHTAYQKPVIEGWVAAIERGRETFNDLRTYFHLISEHRGSCSWSHVFLFRHLKLRISVASFQKC